MLLSSQIDAISQEALNSGFSFDNLNEIAMSDNLDFIVTAVWESSDILLCGGFELLIESEIDLDRLSDCYRRIGIPEFNSMIQAIKRLFSSNSENPTYQELDKLLQRTENLEVLDVVNKEYYRLIDNNYLIAKISAFLKLQG